MPRLRGCLSGSSANGSYFCWENYRINIVTITFLWRAWNMTDVDLGLVEQGALADLLLVKGNPLDNINLIANPTNNFKIIIKNGRIYKNTLSQ